MNTNKSIIISVKASKGDKTIYNIWPRAFNKLSINEIL
jgi:hypothetical protein